MAEQDQVIRACVNLAKIEQIKSVQLLRIRVLNTNPSFKPEEVDEALKAIGRTLTGTYKYEYDQHVEVPHG